MKRNYKVSERMAIWKQIEKKSSHTYEDALELIRSIGYDQRFEMDCYKYLTHRDPVFHLIGDDCRVYRDAEGSDPEDSEFNCALCQEYINKFATVDDINDIIVANSQVKPGQDSRNINLVRKMVVMLKRDGSVGTYPWMNDQFFAAMINGEFAELGHIYKFILEAIPDIDPEYTADMYEDAHYLVSQLVSGKYNLILCQAGIKIDKVKSLVEAANIALLRN